MSRNDLIAGKWEITEMDVWDKATLDLLGPAHLEFDPDGNTRVFTELGRVKSVPLRSSTVNPDQAGSIQAS